MDRLDLGTLGKRSPMSLQPTPNRRSVLTGAAALTAAGFVAQPMPALAGPGKHRTRLTVLGTTDLHGNVFNWDYFKNLEFDDKDHNDIGIAHAATLIKAARARLGRQPVLTLDAGDTIQGTPLAYYYARIDPITGGSTHPMANAMNLVGYDAAALGNHEFNYGIDTLRTFESQLDFPLLGANAVARPRAARSSRPTSSRTSTSPAARASRSASSA